MTDSLTLRVRALELDIGSRLRPSAINIQMAAQTLPVGQKLFGLTGVPTNKLVDLWVVLPWRMTASFCNSQWFQGGAQVPNSATAGVGATSVSGWPVTIMNRFTGTFTASPQLSLYSGVATNIDAFMIGGLVWS